MKGLFGLILILSSVIYSRSQSQRTALHSNRCCDYFFSVLSLNIQIVYLLGAAQLWVQLVKTRPDEAKAFRLNAKPVRLNVASATVTFWKAAFCMKHCDVSIKLSN